MVTQFAFEPIYTTSEMREMDFMQEKVAKINEIRAQRSQELVAKGEAPLDPYTFDYLLLCNKICGASHYNMQMKIVVDTPEDFKKWLSDKATVAEEFKASKAVPVQGETPAGQPTDTSKAKESATAAKVVAAK